ncbi:unnamed protein product, partial [Arabidopsis halleri]
MRSVKANSVPVGRRLAKSAAVVSVCDMARSDSEGCPFGGGAVSDCSCSPFGCE